MKRLLFAAIAALLTLWPVIAQDDAPCRRVDTGLGSVEMPDGWELSDNMKYPASCNIEVDGNKKALGVKMAFACSPSPVGFFDITCLSSQTGSVSMAEGKAYVETKNAQELEQAHVRWISDKDPSKARCSFVKRDMMIIRGKFFDEDMRNEKIICAIGDKCYILSLKMPSSAITAQQCQILLNRIAASWSLSK